MAWSGNLLAADEATNLSNDKPLLGGIQAADQVANAADSIWVVGASGDFLDTDDSDSDFPTLLASDRDHHARTRPTTSGTAFSLLFDFNSAVDDVDSIFIVGHNLGTLGSTTVTVTVADSNDFVTNPQLLATKAGITTDDRFSILALDDGTNNPARISGGRYWRIGITTSVSGLPQIGEVWFTRRRVLYHTSDLPYDDLEEETKINRSETEEGIIFDTILAQGRALRNLNIRTANSDQSDVLKGWWNECGRGADAFIWLEKPSSEADNFHVMKLQRTKRVAPLQGPFDRLWRLNMMEQGPFISAES